MTGIIIVLALAAFTVLFILADFVERRKK